jgi:hypothetical protein
MGLDYHKETMCYSEDAVEINACCDIMPRNFDDMECDIAENKCEVLKERITFKSCAEEEVF